MSLVWEDAGNDEPGDQNADSILRVAEGCTSAYYSLGPEAAPGMWAVELIQLNHGDEVLEAGTYLGQDHPSEEAAKAAAERYEETGETA